MKDRLGSVHKRLETDEELRYRLLLRGVVASSHYGSFLDAYAWEKCQLQRRIVEVVA